MDLISKKYLIERITALETEARRMIVRVPKGSPEFQKYMMQWEERSTFKHKVMDAPVVTMTGIVDRLEELRERAKTSCPDNERCCICEGCEYCFMTAAIEIVKEGVIWKD